MWPYLQSQDEQNQYCLLITVAESRGGRPQLQTGSGVGVPPPTQNKLGILVLLGAQSFKQWFQSTIHSWRPRWFICWGLLSRKVPVQSGKNTGLSGNQG